MPLLTISEFCAVTGLSRRQTLTDIERGLPVKKLAAVIDIDEAMEWRLRRGNRRAIEPDYTKLQTS